MARARFYDLKNEDDFNLLALDLFHYQHKSNPVYREYCQYLGIDPAQIDHYLRIPYLPIRFFKSHMVLCDGKSPEKIFTSSGTTGVNPSKHYVTSLSEYEQSFKFGFEAVYGPLDQYCILAMLPSYTEREDASLAYMVSRMISLSHCSESGYYSRDYPGIHNIVHHYAGRKRKVLLIGVTFALLDFADSCPGNLMDTIIMETGGMKGRRPELVRQEVHQILKASFGVSAIHSEYGMTELLSQAYSTGDGIFKSPPWMKITTREIEDPLSLQSPRKTGGINVMDLANTDTCAFIATQDLGRTYEDGTFEVLGRFDHADVRGCNLMVN